MLKQIVLVDLEGILFKLQFFSGFIPATSIILKQYIKYFDIFKIGILFALYIGITRLVRFRHYCMKQIQREEGRIR